MAERIRRPKELDLGKVKLIIGKMISQIEQKPGFKTEVDRYTQTVLSTAYHWLDIGKK